MCRHTNPTGLNWDKANVHQELLWPLLQYETSAHGQGKLLYTILTEYVKSDFRRPANARTHELWTLDIMMPNMNRLALGIMRSLSLAIMSEEKKPNGTYFLRPDDTCGQTNMLPSSGCVIVKKRVGVSAFSLVAFAELLSLAFFTPSTRLTISGWR